MPDHRDVLSQAALAAEVDEARAHLPTAPAAMRRSPDHRAGTVRVTLPEFSEWLFVNRERDSLSAALLASGALPQGDHLAEPPRSGRA